MSAAKVLRPLFVVAGCGNGSGTGAAAARAFAKAGYSVALIARGEDSLKSLAQEIKASGGSAAPIPVTGYGAADFTKAFADIDAAFPSAEYAVRAALWNAGHAVFKGFLDTTVEELETTLQTNVVGAFAFAQQVIRTLQKNEPEETTGRGTLIFTGATAGVRGNVMTSAFASAKHGVRALSQSLAKEFGKEEIHVAHAIIDGGILTNNYPGRSVATGLKPDAIAQAYLSLAGQDKSAWSWEIDLRPFNEKW
ncbi:NAD(P)-binding protein [Schizophyllum commune H4-8]|uniref:Short-chain dehydrogenase/reductase SDR n=1 Tax=Schizophyllum commune (strain H4-8 / FGSC 9210) TaxID=578458 RepID=D8PW66_SCHCM|nr:NAD(P)-binding protein [Schizophyllum commune H4-8]KAI5900071.1 NAD(P)-binding protein [Schizophyllum commune H4-8]